MVITAKENKKPKWFKLLKNNVDHSKKELQSTHIMAASLVLTSCGSEKTNNTTQILNEVLEEEPILTNLTAELLQGVNYNSPGIPQEILSSDYKVFKTISSITDNDITDNDELNITTSEDITTTPVVTGFEIITFLIAKDFASNDTVFNADLSGFDNFNQIAFSKLNEESQVNSVELVDAAKNLNFAAGLSGFALGVKSNENISISTNENSQITVTGNGKDLLADGNGKSLNIISSNLGDISIVDNSLVSLTAPNAEGNIYINSNGNVSLFDTVAIKGNVEISAIGNIIVSNINSSTAHLDLDNIRGPNGEYISVSNAGNVKSVNINSAGSVISGTGFTDAETIIVSAREDSTITAINSALQRDIILNNTNTNNKEIVFDLIANTIDTLVLGGSAPLTVNVSGSDINGAIVTSTNVGSSTISISAADVDLSKISQNVDLRLANVDGRTITVGPNQRLAMDAEVSQTASVAVPKIKFSTAATNSTSNSITIKTVDTVATNADTLLNVAGINLNDIQTLNLDLSSNVDFDSSGNIIGDALREVVLIGSGNFNLNSNKIIGGLSNPVSLNTSAYSGNISLTLDSTSYGLKSLSGGDGIDTITIDDNSSIGTGYSLSLGGGNDNVSLTTNADSNSAILSIDGGAGIDEVKFATGLDFLLSNLTLSNLEFLEFTGGSNSTKLPSSALSGTAYNLSENGTGNLTLELLATSQTIDLSTLIYDTSVLSSNDKMLVDGTNFLQALTVTTSQMHDEVNGTRSLGDIIVTNNGNDVIRGYGGNDNITPGNGADQVMSGLGNDTINLTEVLSSSDTLFYSVDAGTANVDSVTGFDLIIVDDKISLDTSETLYPITEGKGAAVDASTDITFISQPIDTDLDHSSSVQESIFKLIQTDKSDFATALGTSIITVANNSSIPFLWFDVDTSEAVFGFVYENSEKPDDNTLTSDDTFFEIVRLSMNESDYTNYLGSDNFIFT